MTKGSAVMPVHTCAEVPTRSPSVPLTLGSSLNETLLPPWLKPSISAQSTEIVASGSMKAPPWKLPKR